MVRTGLRNFEIPDAKPVWSAWFATIEIREFLGTDSIASVAFSAVKSDGTDATSDVLDVGACTFSGVYLMPYIKAGATGITYVVTMKVTTSNGAKEQWQIGFSVI